KIRRCLGNRRLIDRDLLARDLGGKESVRGEGMGESLKERVKAGEWELSIEREKAGGEISVAEKGGDGFALGFGEVGGRQDLEEMFPEIGGGDGGGGKIEGFAKFGKDKFGGKSVADDVEELLFAGGGG